MDNSFIIRINIGEVRLSGFPSSGFPSKRLLEELIIEFNAIRASEAEKEHRVIIETKEFDRLFYKYLKTPNYFDWLPIFQDENSVWTSERLLNLKQDIAKIQKSCWYCISRRKDINWNEELIHELSNHLDFKALSGNIKVPWTEFLIDKWVEKWDWEKLSGNGSLPWNDSFLIKYMDRWIWQPNHPPHAYYCYFEHLKYSYPCISTNPGIKWDELLLAKYKSRVDFWLLAKTANLSDKLIIIYADNFYIKQISGYAHFKYSDWYSSENIMESGFEQFPYNDNFFLSDTLIEFARKTRLKYLKNTHNYHEGLIELEDSIYNIWQERFKTLNKSQSNKSEKEKDGMPF